MKSSIKTINEWLIVFMVFFGIIFGFEFIQGKLKFLPESIHYFFNTYPSLNLLRIESLDAISLFSGSEPKGFEINLSTISVLFIVILVFIIGPYLLYLGYKKGKEGKLKPWYWFIGGVICIGSLSIVPTSLLSMKVFENTKESAERNRIKDLMRQELMDVGFATAEFMILNNSERLSFSLEDIGIDDYDYQFTIQGEPTDSLVTIICSNPDKTSFTVKLDVYPDKKGVTKMRN